MQSYILQYRLIYINLQYTQHWNDRNFFFNNKKKVVRKVIDRGFLPKYETDPCK